MPLSAVTPAWAALAITVVLSAASGCGDDSRSPEGTDTDGGELRRLEATKQRLEARLQRLARERREGGERRSDGGSVAGSGLSGVAKLEASLDARIGVAAGSVAGGPVQTAGSIETGPAWSTIKVPIALRVLADAGGPRHLSPEQSSLIEAALTRSDNAAAAALFDQLATAHGGPGGAAEAVTAILRQAGDPATQVSTVGRDGFSTYGQTDWPLVRQQAFMAALARGKLGSAASTAFVLELMLRPISAWGLGSIGLPARWKGGWGPDPDGSYLLRQMGLVSAGGEEIAIAIAVRPGNGSFDSGRLAADELARWIKERLG